jgi:hypothetical protein
MNAGRVVIRPLVKRSAIRIIVVAKAPPASEGS